MDYIEVIKLSNTSKLNAEKEFLKKLIEMSAKTRR